MDGKTRTQVEEFIEAWRNNGGLEAIATIYMSISINPRRSEFDKAFMELASQQYALRTPTAKEIDRALHLEEDIRILERKAAEKCSEFTRRLGSISGYEQSLLWKTYRENNRQVRYGEESITRTKQEFADLACRLINK